MRSIRWLVLVFCFAFGSFGQSLFARGGHGSGGAGGGHEGSGHAVSGGSVSNGGHSGIGHSTHHIGGNMGGGVPSSGGAGAAFNPQSSVSNSVSGAQNAVSGGGRPMGLERGTASGLTSNITSNLTTGIGTTHHVGHDFSGNIGGVGAGLTPSMRFGHGEGSPAESLSARGRHHHLASYAATSDFRGSDSNGRTQIIHGHWNGNWSNGTSTSGTGGAGATRGQSHSQYGTQPFFWGSSAGGVGSNAVAWGQGSLIYGSGYLSYLNPYYSSMDLSGFYNYTQPVVISNRLPHPSKALSATPADFFQGLVNSAVGEFLKGDYDTALEIANRGIDDYPDEAVLHEFRALALFAKGDYQQAAATIHAVLAVGPGWDWTTLISLYRDANVYTTQLRALEANVKQNPDDGAIRFLLAYHYLTDGYPDAAARILRRVVTLVPNDQVAANLLKMVSGPQQPPSERVVVPPMPDPPATASSSPEISIDPAAIVGNWDAIRADGSRFSLNLMDDKKFNWKFTNRRLPPQSLTGTYSLDKNVISLETRGRGSLDARIKFTSENRFNFKAVGSPDTDPGLDFGPSRVN